MELDRRTFLVQAAALAGGLALAPRAMGKKVAAEGAKTLRKAEDLFTISLSQWGFHRAIFGDARDDYSWFIRMLHSEPDAVLKGELDPRDIVVKARELGVDVVDLVNILWFGHGKDGKWLGEFNRRAAGEGVSFGVLMCDELGNLGRAMRRSGRLRWRSMSNGWIRRRNWVVGTCG